MTVTVTIGSVLIRMKVLLEVCTTGILRSQTLIVVGHSHSHGDSHSHSHDVQPHGHSHDAQPRTHSHAEPSHAHSHGRPPAPRLKHKPTEFDMDKLRSTLKQFVRDWSEEGAVEREQCYKPLIDALLEYYPDAKAPEERSLGFFRSWTSFDPSL